MKNIESFYYGDNNRWFLGIAINSNDPLQLGRVQVRIYGIHPDTITNLPSESLPWAQCLLPTTEGGISGIGRMPQIVEGAKVFGIFLDGESSQIPFIMGTVPNTEDPNKQQLLALTGNENALTQSSDEGSYIVGNSPGEKAYNFFLAFNFSAVQAAAIIGCLSVFSSKKLDPASSRNLRFGLAGWNSDEVVGSRYERLKFFAGQRALDFKLFDTQLQFIVYELRSHSNLGLGQLLKMNTVSSAVNIFREKYMKEDRVQDDLRIKTAEGIMERFG
jgi:hypothetical protein